MEEVPRCRHRQFLASVTDPGDSAVFFLFFCWGSTSILVWIPGAILIWLLLCKGLFQHQIPVLEAAWLVVWDGHGEAWESLFCGDMQRKICLPTGKKLAMLSRNTLPQAKSRCQQQTPMPSYVHGRAPKAKSSSLIQLSECPGGCFRIYPFLNTVRKHHSFPLIPCNFNCGAHHLGA